MKIKVHLWTIFDSTWKTHLYFRLRLTTLLRSLSNQSACGPHSSSANHTSRLRLKDLHTQNLSSAELRTSSTISPQSGFKLLLTPLSPQASTPPPQSGFRGGRLL
ncbi:hypothetical protein GOODEAATRI_034375 [Goodea atripinnis]|uniref:Uncharacterized protein n=1 Tax=Goodea atripinnis TaxID=208336 RepID=A0ABV0Q3C9_9TELE